ncbi:hypothetical protein GIB67_018681 [Kingdonia uniflora]|uniref:Exostosin GT47 domain-containing protein n=1 Tax=Kingdonia uniflora TaxID=39325 RepID=A0A7J7LT22_9MAGN|nr:hypothetical protein GIB67_018681 [Kingdonia uniflora]
MGFAAKFHNLCHIETKRLFLVLGVIFISVLAFQFSSLPYRNVKSSMGFGDLSLFHASSTSYLPLDHGVLNGAKGIDKGNERYPDGYSQLEKVNIDTNLVEENAEILKNSSVLEDFRYPKEGIPLEEVGKFGSEDSNLKLESIGRLELNFTSRPGVVDSTKLTMLGEFDANSSSIIESTRSHVYTVGKKATKTLPQGEDSTNVMKPIIKNKENAAAASISQMYSLMLQSRHSSMSMRPRWSSERDSELLHVRLQIENAPIVRNDRELYASVFRNVSMFKWSYELMEHMLKVYIYEEGEKPVFHQPPLKGIYVSEGWFMKLMEGNNQFVVKDPREAHLFYLPFSSQMLRLTLYDPLNKAKLTEHLKNYVDIIASKYRFWNRTGGADHFLASCHDWAPQETIKPMGNCIRSLCNANVAGRFRIGKDISLPVTFVGMPEDPLRSLGGKPASKRPILAFFAGRHHGYLRTILLDYWKNKDPDMKIFGPLLRNNTEKMTYRQYMKSSKYCICARGYEVHTPRVVEAIFYECVPVIISDNYMPPFFEILDWEKFAVFVLEKDIPNLKNILTSIPEKKYRMLQTRVKNVQKHFLWHKKPVKMAHTQHSFIFSKAWSAKMLESPDGRSLQRSFEAKRLALVMGMIVVVVLVVQSSILPYGNIFSSLFPSSKISLTRDSALKSITNDNSAFLNDSNSKGLSLVLGMVNGTATSGIGKHDKNGNEDGRTNDNKSAFANVVMVDKNFTLEKVGIEGPDNGSIHEIAKAPEPSLSVKQVEGSSGSGDSISDNARKGESSFPLENVEIPYTSVEANSPALPPVVSLTENFSPGTFEANSSSFFISGNPNVSSAEKREREKVPLDKNYGVLQTGSQKTSISKMNSLLLKNRASFHSMRPQWSSECDKELLLAKSKIEDAPVIENDPQLYHSVFRNVSIFRRSYELMEQILKIYIYSEGEKPIFHEATEPILQGIYSSEGCSRMLQLTLYKRNSHSRSNLAAYMKKYVELIAASHPFWNRTGGTDHFAVACHDWAPFEVRGPMDKCIKVLCNANAARDFKIGKDVTLPETQVRKMGDPLRDLGGKPSSERQHLAFFAGGMHGDLRPILLKHFGNNQDPDMKIFGQMDRRTYIQYMKSSKYCICARGYDVNSPRVFEALFYDCVPVFVADNYVPPFFEVLDWEKFTVFVEEKDMPKLKEILLSISDEKYVEMQLGVKKVQQHFLWHNDPVKYDIFHMILHSVWFNRLNEI